MAQTEGDIRPAITGASGVTLVIGAGATGLSCVRHLLARGHGVHVMDSRPAPPKATELREMSGAGEALRCFFGGWQPAALTGVRQVVVSPGVALGGELGTLLQRKLPREVPPPVGDITLFAEAARAPILGVTGTNGKSTVCAWATELLRQAGKAVLLGGNFGTPALSLLEAPTPDYYLLELSSFQLDTSGPLDLAAAALLNIRPDHLDRYADLGQYAASKLGILSAASRIVAWREDPLIAAGLGQLDGAAPVTFFSAESPQSGQDFGIASHAGEAWFLRGDEPLLPVRALPVPGRHNQLNLLAALALVQATGCDPRSVLGAVPRLVQLSQRLQPLPVAGPLRWWNDSKATNVAAAVSAIESVAAIPARPLVLIAGGLAKGQDFADLVSACRGRVAAVVLLGRDRELLAAAFGEHKETGAGAMPALHRAKDMRQAVALAGDLAAPAGQVLLAPACASMDMFADYQARGAAYAEAVAELTGSHSLPDGKTSRGGA